MSIILPRFVADSCCPETPTRSLLLADLVARIVILIPIPYTDLLSSISGPVRKESWDNGLHSQGMICSAILQGNQVDMKLS